MTNKREELVSFIKKFLDENAGFYFSDTRNFKGESDEVIECILKVEKDEEEDDYLEPYDPSKHPYVISVDHCNASSPSGVEYLLDDNEFTIDDLSWIVTQIKAGKEKDIDGASPIVKLVLRKF